MNIRPRTGRRNYAKGGAVEDEDVSFPQEGRDIASINRPIGAWDQRKSTKIFGEDVFDTPDKRNLLPEDMQALKESSDEKDI